MKAYVGISTSSGDGCVDMDDLEMLSPLEDKIFNILSDFSVEVYKCHSIRCK
jgi:hypothetical protein